MALRKPPENVSMPLSGKLWPPPKLTGLKFYDRALATHSATPDKTGYSPYEKVFRHQKPSMGIALPTDSLAEDISQFFERMNQHDRDLTTALRDEQDKRGLAYDKNRSQPVYYKSGQCVWVKCAPG